MKLKRIIYWKGRFRSAGSSESFSRCGKTKIALVFLKIYLFTYFLEREKRKEKERERNISVWLPLICPLLGTWPASQACVLSRNGTGGPLLHSPVVSPLSTPARADLENL